MLQNHHTFSLVISRLTSILHYSKSVQSWNQSLRLATCRVCEYCSLMVYDTVVVRSVPGIMRDGGAYIIRAQSWSAGPFSWRQCDTAEHQELPTQEHNVTLNKTWISCSSAVRILDLARTVCPMHVHCALLTFWRLMTTVVVVPHR